MDCLSIIYKYMLVYTLSMNAMIKAIGLAAAIGLATWAIIGAVAFAQPTKHVWVLVVDQTCNFDNEQWKADIQVQKAYAPYVSSLDVVCFPNADMNNLHPIVTALKSVYPDDVFVFAYDFRVLYNKVAWHQYIAHDNGQSSDGVFGRASIKEGFAVAALSPYVIAHEATHLTLAKVHLSTADNDHPENWVKEPFYTG